MILLECDFMVVFKKGKTHQKASHLSCLIHGGKPTAVEDDFPDTYLFNIDMIPRWSEEMVPLLTIGQIHVPTPLREK